jgi:uncharacterized DUF497 family protein
VPRPSRGGRAIHRPFIFVAQSCPEEKGSFVHITWRDDKERRNIRKHGLDFSSAERVLVDPLSNTMPDRVVDGEERWHTIGAAVLGGAFKIVVVVHSYPDPDDETWIHVISLPEATAHERRQYEISRF